MLMKLGCNNKAHPKLKKFQKKLKKFLQASIGTRMFKH
ncbi:hypothetical protein SAMN05421545_3397 [Pontibacter lucknowensis]|uniref:Uncharacterized protein n=1 Tax=Pontibacter lucknowensis TaxID=1077936 RepID=A0A1N7AD40_9BACT|nr:hypothetical protein SAMN05421545_3397 [Pontibacter lucknowensis]